MNEVKKWLIWAACLVIAAMAITLVGCIFYLKSQLLMADCPLTNAELWAKVAVIPFAAIVLIVPAICQGVKWWKGTIPPKTKKNA